MIDIDASQRRLILRDGALDYDILIVAAGTRHAHFGHDEWERLAPGLKSIEDALEIRRRILFAYEAAEREQVGLELLYLYTWFASDYRHGTSPVTPGADSTHQRSASG